MNQMQAILLLGGKGTRIQSLFGDRPKCLVPVAGKPFLLWQLEWLKKSGVRRVHLAAGHMADVLKGWLETHAPADMEITLSVEPDPRGTGGAIKFAEPWIHGDPFFVLNGDTLAPGVHFGDMRAAHVAAATAEITIGVAPVSRTGRYGTVEFDEAGRVTAFLEKEERAQGWINTGVYCMNRKVLDRIEVDRNISIETGLFPVLAHEGLLRVQPVEPPLLDMGTPDGLREMTDWLAKDKVVCG
jgi:D-glycero-alpha-D-manno-heptose 1-phosphate guanylyltransferase